MQSYNFRIRHIRGSLNTIADYLSRIYAHSSPPNLSVIAERGVEEDGHMSTTYIDLLWTLGRSSNVVGPEHALSRTSNLV